MSHTKEPWRLVSILIDQIEVVTDSKTVLHAARKADAYGDYRRIVACVNACAGIPTELIEQGGFAAVPAVAYGEIKRLRQALRDIADSSCRETLNAEKCEHGQYGYEHCENCCCEFAEKSLTQNVQIEGLATPNFDREFSMSGAQEPSKTDDGQSRLAVGLERMAISEDEHITLISDGRCSQCAFGSGIWLLPVEGNRWAFDMIAKMRSNAINNAWRRILCT